MRILKKFVRKLYHLIWFLSIFIFFLPIVKAESYGGTLNTDISSPFRAMAFDDYGNYWVPRQNSQYFFETGFNVSCQYGVRTCGFSIETQQSYAAGHYYGVTIYLYHENKNYRIVPPPSGARRIGMGNSMNAARVNWVNNSNDVSQVIYTNYSYDNFTINLSNGNPFTGVYSLTYFFKTITNNIGLAVPFNVDANVGTSATYYLVGYVLTDLGSADGLTESQVTHAIQNSGLATASSVQEVQRGVNQVQQQLSGVQDSVDDVNDTLNDDNVDGANSQVDDLLDNDNFDDSTGIQSIINAPLNFINSLSNTCSPINVTIPYIDKPLQIPCIKQELNNHIPLIVPILSTAINGFIVYRILLDLVRIIKNSRNPDDDRIEVLDL